jgi:hypothetical protein
MAGKGKPCGASHISAAKVCRVSLGPEVNRALAAATGQVGAATLKEAVKKYAGAAGVARLRELRQEIRGKEGGNIVKGPKADELKKRLQAEGLLPNGKAKSVAPEEKPVVQWAPKQRDKSVPPDLKAQLAALRNGDDAGAIFAKNVAAAPKTQPKPLSKPDPLYGAWGTEELKEFRAGFKEDNPGLERARNQIDAELARRGVKRVAPANSLEALATNQLKDRRNAAWALGRDEKVAKLDAELARRGAAASEPIVASAKSKLAIQSARSFDKDMAKEQLRRDGDQTFDQWDETTGTGAKKLGQGAFGTVIKSKDGSHAVKRGDISDTEAKLIQKLGEQDLGPKLIAADVDGPGWNGAPGVNNRRGRIAMSVVDGEPIGDRRRADDEIGGVKVADAYWTARAQLHRMGIAHNDMHIDNVLVDSTGKGRFVDMGLAQDNPKAAFAEAMGAFVPPRGGMVTRPAGVQGQGDWQVRRYDGTGGRLMEAAQKSGNYKEIMRRAPVAARVLDNKNALQYRMGKDGFSKDDIATIMDHGLRNDLSTYSQGVWQRITDDQAREYINILYDGI